MTAKVKDKYYTIDVKKITATVLSSNYAKNAELQYRDVMIDLADVIKNSLENILLNDDVVGTLDAITDATADFSTEVESYVYGNSIKEALLQSSEFIKCFTLVTSLLKPDIIKGGRGGLTPYVMTKDKSNLIFCGVIYR